MKLLLYKTSGKHYGVVTGMVIILLLHCGNAEAQSRYYVNQAVTASGNGGSWATAFKTLQEAIDKTSSSVVDEIWVAKGTYYPNKNPFGTRFDPPSYSKSMTFYLNRAMKIYGGFNGTEANVTDRNFTTNPTTLSANINDPADSTDNVYHVILAIGTEAKPIGNDLVIDGFTITGGYANVTGAITVNQSTAYYYNGGGIYNIYASPTLNNLNIVKNVGFVGGGIHNRYSSPILNNVNITNNYSGASGGGIYNAVSSPKLNNVIISYNRVNNEGGGGMNNTGSSPELNNVTISNNQAFQGAGIYNTGDSIKMTNVVIKDNTAKTDGGGMYNFSETHVDMTNVDIVDNTAQYGGGIRSFRASLTINGGNISGNRASYYGGGAFIVGCTMKITGAAIANNEAVTYQGGGLFIDEESHVTFNNATISGNKAKTDAGGLLFRAGAIGVLKDVVISKNVSGRQGGGVYLVATDDPALQPSFTDVTFSENVGNTGGGIYLNITTPTFTNVTFSNNTSNSGGGGMCNAAWAYPILKQVIFSNNKAANGGGMFSQNSALPVLTNVSFRGNEATERGGAIYNDCNAIFTGIVIKGNKAKIGGGMYNSLAPVLTNMLFSGNLATESGGGLYVQAAAPTLTNVTFSGNNAVTSGGAMYLNGSRNTKIRNTVVYGNSSGISFVNGLPSITYSLVQQRTATTNGNISGDLDPKFTNAPDYTTAPFTTGDYTLQGNSPAADEGDNSLYEPGAVPDLSAIKTDLAGNNRFYNTVVDMGAYEYGAGALPLKLISFKAEKQYSNVQLVWETTNEVNVSHFEVEQSINGQTFTTVGKVSATAAAKYQFTHFSPTAAATVYYRLRIADLDGTFSYSAIAVINNQPAQRIQLIMYPNPATTTVVITGAGNRQLTGDIQFINAEGRVVLQTRTSPVDVRHLALGVYVVRFVDKDGTVEMRKLVINHP